MSALVAQIFQMRVKMKNLMGVMEGGSIPALSGLEDALKAEQKVSSISFSSLTCDRVLMESCQCVLGSTWNCKEEEKGGFKEEICRVSIKQAWSSWLRLW